MLKAIVFVMALLLITFLVYVAGRETQFYFEKSAVINARADKIFPYLNSFKLGSQWSPYEKIDPAMKKILSGPESGVGAVMEFDGNAKAGSGKLEILESVPNQKVEIQLTMTKPFGAQNRVRYELVPQSDGQTKFTWSIEGENNYLSKLVSVFIDCQKILDEQFSHGINNLKNLMENQK